MEDKVEAFLKLPEIEQKLLSQQREMLSSVSDDEYTDFLCENEANCSLNNDEEEINTHCQQELEIDKKGTLNESLSHDEDFRAKDTSPYESVGSQDEDFRAKNITPYESFGSQDEDFRAKDVSPQESVKRYEVKNTTSHEFCDSYDEDFKAKDTTPPHISHSSHNMDFQAKDTSLSDQSSHKENFIAKDTSPPPESDNIYVEDFIVKDNIPLQLNQTISSKDFGNVSDLKQLLVQVPQSLLCKMSKTSDLKSLSHSSSFTGGQINKYSRVDMLKIRSSKTPEEWKSFLWTNHGTNWPIDEMPFEMDSDLRCSFHKRINILRERQEAARRFFVSSRPQIDIPVTNDSMADRQRQLPDYTRRKNDENKKKEQKQEKKRIRKNRKGKNSVDGGINLKRIKGENKENTKINQNQATSNSKADWTDSEECDLSSESAGLNKKANNDQNKDSAPSASRWALRYLENITSSDNDDDKEKGKNQNDDGIDNIANRKSLVGFPFWQVNSDHPDWQHSKNILDFYLEKIKKGISEMKVN